MILNAYWEPLDFELPPVDERFGIHGDDGSIRRSIRRTRLSNGMRRRRSPLLRIVPGRVR